MSAPQLVAVLERLTLALDAPEQLAISSDTDGLVAVLEQLALALKSSGQKALGNGTEAPVQEAQVECAIRRAPTRGKGEMSVAIRRSLLQEVKEKCYMAKVTRGSFSKF